MERIVEDLDLPEFDLKISDKDKKHALNLEAYFYIKKLYNNGDISRKQLDEIKEKYSIDVD